MLQEWKVSQPALEKKLERAASAAAPKAWRFVGEMEEIAAAFNVGHYATVSVTIARLKRDVNADHALRGKLEDIEERLH